MEAVECGSTALGIILSYYGRIVPLAELRRQCGVTRHGVNAYEICCAARHYALEARGRRVSLTDLAQLPCPFIIHWAFHHFVVVEGFARNGVYVNDPGFGPRWIAWEEFSRNYTGVLLDLRPGPNFQKGGRRPPVWRLAWEPLARSWPAVTYCTLAGLLLVVPGLAVPVFSQVFIDALLLENRVNWLRPFLLGMTVVLLLQAALQYLQKRYQRRLQVKLSATMSSRFLWHILRLPVGFYEQRDSGEVASRSALNQEVAAFAVGPLASLAIQVVLLCFYAAAMFAYDVVLTSLALAAAAANGWILWRTTRRQRDFQMRLLQEGSRLNGLALGGLQGIETLKASGREEGYFNRWAGGYARTLMAMQDLEQIQLHLGLLPVLFGGLTNTAVLVVGGLRVMEGNLTLGMLIAFQSLLWSFQAPLAQLSQTSFQIQQMHANLSRLDDVHANPTDPLTERRPDAVGAEVKRLTGLVELRDVVFGYSPNDPPLIQGFSLTLQAGRSVALVGASGSGKSTLAKLVAGLYQPWEGEILFDGLQRVEIPLQVFASCVAYVEQIGAFFGGTIADNLTLWDQSITPAQLTQSCRAAAIQDVVEKLSGGYNAELFEAAANLSGGERQRLEIARALLRAPALLILDEVSNALDTETEHRVHYHIREQACSCLIIAHRLSTVRDCDEILVLKDGRVVEQGNHEELWLQNGEYVRLIQAEADEDSGLDTPR